MLNKPIPADRELIIKDNILIKLKLDGRNIIEFANDDFIDLVGYDVYEIISHNFDTIRHPDTPNTIYDYLWENILTKQDTYLIAKFLSKSGAFFWLQIRFELKINEDTNNLENIYLYCSKVDKSHKDYLSKIYSTILNIEKHSSLKVAENYFSGILEEKQQNYTEFIHSFCKD